MYYRLEIAPAEGRPLYRSDDVLDMLAVKIPDGVLKPGKRYRWRVRSSDSDKWREIQNRSQTPWIEFTTADRFAKEHLFDLLGISDFTWDRFENGVIASDGGLLLSSRYMAKIGLLVLNEGKYNGLRVVSKSWVAESTRIHILGDGTMETLVRCCFSMPP